MKRLLITGAGGVIGSALSTYFTKHHPGRILVDRAMRISPPGSGSAIACDLESASAVCSMIDQTQPDIVLHLAGNKDIFVLENTRDLAWRANVLTTKHLAAALRGSHAFLVFLSTDYVFEGIRGPYRETSPTRPTTEYGKSKLAAEGILRESGLQVAIARSSSIFGFEGDFVSTVIDALSQGRTYSAFSDLVSNPTALPDLYEMLRRIIDRRLGGIFHTSGSESLSREEFAREIAGASALEMRLVRGEKRAEHVRPPDLSLDNSASYKTLDYWPLSLDEALQHRLAGQHRA